MDSSDPADCCPKDWQRFYLGAELVWYACHCSRPFYIAWPLNYSSNQLAAARLSLCSQQLEKLLMG